MIISENIRKKRQERQMTLEEVAIKLGTSKQTVQRYESGVISNIPSDKIEGLAKIFSTTPAALMGWEELDESKKPATVSDDGLNLLENRVIMLFRQIPLDKQGLVLDMIETALRSQGLL